MSSSRVYVFDIDGVVRTYWPGRMEERLRRELDLPVGTIEETAFAGAFGRDLVEGRMTRREWTEQLSARIARLTGRESAARSVVREWARDIGQLVPDTIALIDELRSRHPVFALTNGTDRTVAELMEHGIDDRFVQVLNSYAFGVAKPEQECFDRAHRAIEDAVGGPVDPKRVCFTDDLADNVSAASTFGWTAVRFTDGRDVRRAFGVGDDSAGHAVRSARIR